MLVGTIRFRMPTNRPEHRATAGLYSLVDCAAGLSRHRHGDNGSKPKNQMLAQIRMRTGINIIAWLEIICEATCQY